MLRPTRITIAVVLAPALLFAPSCRSTRKLPAVQPHTVELHACDVALGAFLQKAKGTVSDAAFKVTVEDARGLIEHLPTTIPQDKTVVQTMTATEEEVVGGNFDGPQFARFRKACGAIPTKD